ncbi:MAG: T9SS type A sorting domain-containing protein [Ignavibacteriales bacterium]|nr:T9SS type A sorting domain-containing protein [Ignavibacteriales bacterium]
MRIVRNIFIVFFVLVVSMQGQWITIPTAAVDACFLNEQTGWQIANTAGLSVLKTTDGGSTWNTKGFFPATGKKVIFSDNMHGFVGADSGRIYQTADGGESWQLYKLNSNVPLYSMAAISADTVWALGGFGLKTYVYKTADAGLNWNAIDTISGSVTMTSPLTFTDGLHGWIIRGGATMFKTVDGGWNWSSIQGLPTGVASMQFKDSTSGWLGCVAGKLATTTDGGNTWAQKQIFASGTILDLHWNGTELWALGENKHIAFSADMGNSWDTTLSLPGGQLKKIVRFNQAWGIVTGINILCHYNKTEPLFAINRALSIVTDTVLTLAWSSSFINSISLQYKAANGATWRVIASGIPPTQNTYPLTVGDTLYTVRFFDDSRPSFPIGVVDSVQATKPRKANALAVNQVKIFQTADGMSGNSPALPVGGVFWPGGVSASKKSVYADGVVWGGFKNGTMLTGGVTYNSGLQSGRILSNGTATDPADPESGVWRIKDNWEALPVSINKSRLQHDYEAWPVGWGAPYKDVNHDGIFTAGIDKPGVLADETLWLVTNDLDPVKTYKLYGSQPIGLEVCISMFAANEPNLKNVVFKKYEVVNRSGMAIDSMFFGVFSDPDIGDKDDDWVGCDVPLNLGYCYNGDQNDGTYGFTPPAVGYALMQGPVKSGAVQDSAFFNWQWRKGRKNLPLKAFSFFYNGSSQFADSAIGKPEGTPQLYNLLNGKTWNGSAYINPVTNQPSTFPLDGDPVLNQGWTERRFGYAPGDRRLLISCGPFSFAPGEKQEFAYAILIDSADNNLNAIQKVKELVPVAQAYYHSLSVSTLTAAEDNKVTQRGFTLAQNYPNPFNPSTIINYQLAESGKVTLKVYDILGNEVITLVNEEQAAGRHQAVFSLADKKTLASGVYFYRLQAGANSVVKKMMLMK